MSKKGMRFNMGKKSTIVLLTIISIAIIILAVVIVYNITKVKNNEQADISGSINIEEFASNTIDENAIGNYIVTTNADEEKVTPNTKITFYKKYTDCGHTIKEKSTAEASIVNLTEEELRKVYKDWDVIYFSKDLIEVYKEMPGQCGEHYLVKENEGIISVYKVTNNGETILMENTEIEIGYLPDIDRMNLKNGVKIIGKEELNSYLENFE